MKTMLPKPILETHDGILVVREDLIDGGSKRRGVELLITDDHAEYVYATPAQGYAQIAIAHGCAEAGKKATLFVAKRKELYHLTQKAKDLGAEIREVEHGYLSVVTKRARDYVASQYGLFSETPKTRYLLPFGLDCEEMLIGISTAAIELQVEPKEVWCACSSGTLTRALQRAWPEADHYAVRVGAKSRLGNAEAVVAPEKYAQKAKDPPPFPSCPNYDAKVWQFVKNRPGALYWNM